MKKSKKKKKKMFDSLLILSFHFKWMNQNESKCGKNFKMKKWRNQGMKKKEWRMKERNEFSENIKGFDFFYFISFFFKKTFFYFIDTFFKKLLKCRKRDSFIFWISGFLIVTLCQWKAFWMSGFYDRHNMLTFILFLALCMSEWTSAHL